MVFKQFVITNLKTNQEVSGRYAAQEYPRKQKEMKHILIILSFTTTLLSCTSQVKK